MRSLAIFVLWRKTLHASRTFVRAFFSRPLLRSSSLRQRARGFPPRLLRCRCSRFSVRFRRRGLRSVALCCGGFSLCWRGFPRFCAARANCAATPTRRPGSTRGLGHAQPTSRRNLDAVHLVPAPQLDQRDSKSIRDGHQRIALARGVENVREDGADEGATGTTSASTPRWGRSRAVDSPPQFRLRDAILVRHRGQSISRYTR